MTKININGNIIIHIYLLYSIPVYKPLLIIISLKSKLYYILLFVLLSINMTMAIPNTYQSNTTESNFIVNIQVLTHIYIYINTHTHIQGIAGVIQLIYLFITIIIVIIDNVATITFRYIYISFNMQIIYLNIYTFVAIIYVKLYKLTLCT